MQSQPTPARLAPTATGVLVVDGYGVQARVERGRLSVADGIGRQRRAGHFGRAGSGLRRLIVLGHTGSITFDALRWLADAGVGLVQLDTDGRVLAASAGLGRDDPRLRRAQARAIDTPMGDAIARRLIAEKLAAQADTLAAVEGVAPIGDDVVATLADVGRRLHMATSRTEIRTAEALGASAYWGAWSGLTVRFARRDETRVPDAWRTFGIRSSPLTSSPRLALNPANAILNYLYAILEAEARLACLTVGLDPGLGVLHADQNARDSLALDVVEPVRPVVDRYVLSLLAERPFRAADFAETRQGVCRVLEPLTHELAETALAWRALLGPVAEGVAGLLLAGEGVPAPTPISGRNRSLGRGRADTQRPQILPRGAAGCLYCGGAPASGRRTCDACAPEVVPEAGRRVVAAGLRKLAERRAAGERPGHTTDANRARGQRVAEQLREVAAWRAGGGVTADEATYRADILPGLRSLSVRDIARAAGVGTTYASLIRRGERVPHPRLWPPLRALGGHRDRPMPSPGR